MGQPREDLHRSETGRGLNSLVHDGRYLWGTEALSSFYGVVGVLSPAETLRRRRGSCRDVATLYNEACRYCGLAARFVSGYLLSSAAVRDVASTHAWSEIYLPAGGWRGFDSTSGQQVGGEHVAVAVHRHPEAIPPVAGAFLGPAESHPVMTVEVRTTEL